jgi:hypothetical protein
VSKIKRGTTPKETYMETAKGVWLKFSVQEYHLLRSQCTARVKKAFWKNMTIYVIRSIVNMPLLNTPTAKNIKSGFLLTGIWTFNTGMFTDEDFCD